MPVKSKIKFTGMEQVWPSGLTFFFTMTTLNAKLVNAVTEKFTVKFRSVQAT